MKTVTVSKIIRTAQMGDTRYVLLTEAEAEIAALRNQLSAEQTSVNELSLANQELHKRQRVLVETLEQVRHWIMGGIWCFDKSPDEFIRAALAAKEG